jgi:hypothetical protein
VTLTAGGNDLFGVQLPRAILHRLDQIAQRIQPLGARVIVNTVYDPSDGDDDVGGCELGLSRLATLVLRRRLNSVNMGIVRLHASAASCPPISSDCSTATASHRVSLGLST